MTRIEDADIYLSEDWNGNFPISKSIKHNKFTADVVLERIDEPKYVNIKNPGMKSLKRPYDGINSGYLFAKDNNNREYYIYCIVYKKTDNSVRRTLLIDTIVEP
jgi:hypothetical protein